jgi:hypothetical protein
MRYVVSVPIEAETRDEAWNKFWDLVFPDPEDTGPRWDNVEPMMDDPS